MQNIFKKILGLVALVCSLSLNAQTDTTVHSWRCGNDSFMFNNISLDSNLLKIMTGYNNTILSKTTSTTTPGPYIIPVVFHIISSTTTTITHAQIKWQVAALNAAYQNEMLQFTGNAPGSYTANTNIEFRLACTTIPSTVTWSNPSEPGVMRYSAVTDPTILNQGYVDPTVPAATYTPIVTLANYAGAFPHTDYLNVYCVPNIALPGGSGTMLGFSTFP